MSLFQLINDKINAELNERNLEDTPENRIAVLRKLEHAIEIDEQLSTEDAFNIMKAVRSEISVQRVRTHLKNLPLF